MNPFTNLALNLANVQFAWPYVFAVLPLPLLVALFSRRPQPQPHTALWVPFYAGMETALSRSAPRRPRLRLLLASIAWLLLIAAGARPQWLGEPLELPVSGRDLLLAVDISRSMEEQDMILGGGRTTRLRAVKAVAGEFIERREGDRIGLILFGSQPYLQTPLTFDRTTVRALLYESETRLAGNATAIGDAVGLAVKRLRAQPQENQVLILLTDGQDNASKVAPLKAAAIAAQEGLRIYTIGVGADETLVRNLFGMQRINPSAELDEATLQAIAEQTGGKYFRARDTESLEEIYALLDELEPVAKKQETYRPIRELYPWPLAGALAMSMGLALATSGLSRRAHRRQRAYVRESG